MWEVVNNHLVPTSRILSLQYPAIYFMQITEIILSYKPEMRPSQSQPTSFTLSIFFFHQYLTKDPLQKAACISHVSWICRHTMTEPQPCSTAPSFWAICSSFLQEREKPPKFPGLGFERGLWRGRTELLVLSNCLMTVKKMINWESALKLITELTAETPNLEHILSCQACRLPIRLMNAEYGPAPHMRRGERPWLGLSGTGLPCLPRLQPPQTFPRRLHLLPQGHAWKWKG